MDFYHCLKKKKHARAHTHTHTHTHTFHKLLLPSSGEYRVLDTIGTQCTPEEASRSFQNILYTYSVVYVFLKQWKKYFYLLVMCYKLLICHDIPQCNILDPVFLVPLSSLIYLVSSTHYLFFCMYISFLLVNDGYIVFGRSS
jgi:hypothetical protein